jgi:hypothetical protein
MAVGSVNVCLGSSLGFFDDDEEEDFIRFDSTLVGVLRSFS